MTATFENGCCYGVAKAILVALREKVGYPYTVIPGRDVRQRQGRLHLRHAVRRAGRRGGDDRPCVRF